MSRDVTGSCKYLESISIWEKNRIVSYLLRVEFNLFTKQDFQSELRSADQSYDNI